MPQKARPPISVVIPTLNEGKYLGECLRHVRAQNYPGEFELVVADGKSRDATVSIAKKFGAKVVYEPENTIASGRQVGAEAAGGEIIVYTDADARPPKDWLVNLLSPFSNPRVVCTYGSLSLYDYRKSALFFGSLMSTYLFWADVFGIAAGAGSNMAVRKSALEKIGGFNTGLVTGEDVDVQARLKKVGRVVFIHRAKTAVSARRLRSWGFSKFVWFHATNMLSLFLTGKGHEKFEPVR
jgi:glycosyltransferase involved in cell wall biosynthesis